ncbi:MAG: type II secretion system protein GspF [Deltaproteobacteria bacterium HGW-Deltaproteobacteria-6]|nr:MAG: type II secretion system protein GspF [Deltaproteobacteria bacterium HGW-Deltaproteobacteria-6]
MPIFSYRSTTREGIVAEGVIEAADQQAALDRIINTGVIPLEVKAAAASSFMSKFQHKTSTGDLVSFTAELQSLLEAGLPLDKGLNILSEISEHKKMKETIQSLLKSVRGGVSFSDALSKHPQIFPRFYVNMVRAGEQGGILGVTLERLNEFLESSKELKDHLISSMIYPAILFVTGGISIIVLLTFVLPRFSVIFAELGSALPVSTQILLMLSEGLKSYGWILLVAMIASWFALKNYIASDAGRYQWDGFKLKFMKDTIQKLETARFCRTLGTLLSSGVPLLQALNNSREVIGNRVIALAIEDVSKGAKEGRGISEPLAQTGIFPPLALSMIRVGEETGTIDQMLIRIAVIYEKSLKQAVKRLMSLLEPLMILFMGLVIGFIVVSMLLAVFSISDIPL